MTSNLLLGPYVRIKIQLQYVFFGQKFERDDFWPFFVAVLPCVSIIRVFQSFKSLIALRNILLSLLDQLSLYPCLASNQLDKLHHAHQQIEMLEPIALFPQQIDQRANR